MGAGWGEDGWGGTSWGSSVTVDATLPALIQTPDTITSDVLAELPGLSVEAYTGAQAALTLPALTVSAELTVTQIASVDAILPGLSVSAYTGAQVIKKLPALRLVASLLTGTISTVSKDLPGLTMSAELEVPITATVDANLPGLTISANLVAANILEVDIDIPAMKVVANILAGTVSTVDKNLPGLTLSAEAIHSIISTVAATLPAMTAEGELLNLVYTAIIMNLEKLAISRYDAGFEFDSIVEFEGVFLAVNKNGLYELTGDKDNITDEDDGDNIAASIRTGQSKFGTSLKKKVRDCYVVTETDGGMVARPITDAGVGSRSPIESLNANLGTKRAKFGRGIVSTSWGVQIENVNGKDFSLDEIEFDVQPLTRRVGSRG